jgi:hypothetical protein
MNLIENVTFGLIGGTYGVTGLGVIDGGQLLSFLSVIIGGGAMVAALIDKNYLQKKKLNTQLTIEM